MLLRKRFLAFFCTLSILLGLFGVNTVSAKDTDIKPQLSSVVTSKYDEKGNLVFFEAKYQGNIYDLTGVTPDRLKDSVILHPYSESRVEVDRLNSENLFNTSMILGYATIGDGQVILSQNGGSISELLFYQDKVLNYEIQPEVIGKWEDNAKTINVEVLQYNIFAPVPNSENATANIEPDYPIFEVDASFRYPSQTPQDAFIAAVGGYIRTDTNVFIDVWDSCSAAPWFYDIDYYTSSAHNWTTYIIAGGHVDYSTEVWPGGPHWYKYAWGETWIDSSLTVYSRGGFQTDP